MAETLLTIQEAAKISGKSIQTIRRALKGKKIKAKKQRTPQGFNYSIIQDSLISFYKLPAALFEREQQSLGREENLHPKKTSTKEVSTEFATMDDLKKMQQTVENLLGDHKKEKENFMRFMKAFQDRFMAMENQMKLLEQPKKHWFRFWK